MDKCKKTPSAEELLRRIVELEKDQAHIQKEISKLMLSGNWTKCDHKTSNSTSPHQQVNGGPSAAADHGVAVVSSFHEVIREPDSQVMEPLATNLTETQYLSIMQSMGQAVHIFDLKHRIIFWNRTAESLYGFTPAEAYGKTPTELLVQPKDAAAADQLLERTVSGESWSGEFPVKNSRGEHFVVVCTNTPFHDENKRLIGGMCVSSDARPYKTMKPQLGVAATTWSDSQQTSIASKISKLASKVKLKMKTREEDRDHDVSTSDRSDYTFQSEGRTPTGNIGPSPFEVFISTGTEEHYTGKITIGSGDESDNKLRIRKILSSKAEAWIGKVRIVWPWKRNENKIESVITRFGRSGWYPMNINQEHERGLQLSSAKLDCSLGENTSNMIEASGLWFPSMDVSNSSITHGSGSGGVNIKSNATIKGENQTESIDYEIFWEELITKEQIGQGLCGTVYHALWHGSDVAVKVFAYQGFADDVILSFKQEVSIMKRLHHPNILLFMGAVTSPPHLCIVTEFLPGGTLFSILQRNTTRLNWRRRLHMAMDIARGMNYLHHCNPPIVHGDLKSSNLLVGKHWTVKVGDFGLSRVKDQSYLKTNSGKGTPQWMAPELIHSEQADEKSDVYSYGVVLWEIITEKIPWDDLNPMQVIAAVGFMNRRLEIPEDVDPLWVSLIESCWFSEPQSRPTFQEILCELEDLQNKFVAERRR